MEINMEKLQNKLLDKVNNGYGIVQAMEALGIKEGDVVKLMQEDYDLCKKLKKRFANVAWIEKVEFKGVTEELPNSDTPELAALKAEAKELGVEFNPQIGYDKLKKRVDEFKAKQAEEETSEETETPEA